MKGRLLFLNLVLVSLLGAVIWRMQVVRQDAQQREQMVLLQQIQLRKTLPPPPIPAVAAVTPMTYMNVAQQMLFAKDRNPNVIVPPPPPPPAEKPMPELPTANGAMTFNGETSVFLTAKSGSGQKVYRAGDTVGPFKLISVDRSDIVFEWEGKKIEKKLAELKPKDNAPAQSASYAPPSPAPSATVSVAGSGTTDRSAPGADTGTGFRACQVGDASPNGTVAGGFKKVIAASMMGSSCHWEAVK
ncbi:MAG: hypothetical protein ABI823_01705 [Bryobacteraceae bacterium]